ncbi:MAG TPA: GntR family transcriptional regulator [Gaiellaceae bacterium]
MTELPDITIDRDSPVPFYFQLAELLEQEITSGRWQPGSKIPSEPELGERYVLSRTTIRQALGRLEQEGLITRSKGRGTFVSSSTPRSWLIQTTEGFFHDEFVRTGHRVTSRVLRSERATLPRWASDALTLPLGSEGVVIERVRAVDQLVALYVTNWLPESVAELVLGLDPDESLYQRLAQQGIPIVGGRRTVEAVTAGPRLAELLEVDPADALAYIESVSWTSDKRPLDCYRVWLRTDRMRLDISVSAQHWDGVQLPDVVAASPR